MTATVRTLLFSHVTVFAAGFFAGKMIHADELDTYREIHESSFTKFVRKMKKVALAGGMACAAILLARVSMGKSKQISSE